ncbi:MAG TPA: sigma-70 family RNA polymerase sigma factor [Edaphobacter sp.]|jgi:RNA polymerase sigma-70 factor (ECF subfamily)|nr:sigma-70 family RNA polymerase sigma factor [Edaphobacter sp.]
MQAQPAYIAGERNAVAHICKQHATQLQDAVSRYLPALYRRAYRYVENPHDAEDAVQDALLSAYKHLDQFKGTAKMTTWLTTIVTNSALTQLRRRSHQPHASLNEQLNEEQDYFLSDTLADARPNPEDVCSSSESYGFLMQFLSVLSPSLRRAIQLRYIDGLSVREAAQLQNVPVATMKARLWRARAQLKRMMSKL